MVESRHAQRLRQAGNPTCKIIPEGELLIGGKWVDSEAGETMEVLDPTTEAVITRVQKAAAVDANLAIKAAYAAFVNGPWGRMHHEERAKILFKPYTDFRDIIMPHCSLRLVRDAGFEPVIVGLLVSARSFDAGSPVYNTGMSGAQLARAPGVLRLSPISELRT